eukprot:CAMPEP_0194281452 /NCGR_PEP_ID=MMETSP0169-20130528/20738_1 /TAXON_ID=218684 /ORGANISM="Corethron pennatum, Strain L29A3" /LENGTH=351 /DNA_ID=CAMNT_0039026511 /DNA_START=93 /DNA_END=1148 /DNA_ORIENTATION=+
MMRKSTSMLELADLEDLKEFDRAIDYLANGDCQKIDAGTASTRSSEGDEGNNDNCEEGGKSARVKMDEYNSYLENMCKLSQTPKPDDDDDDDFFIEGCQDDVRGDASDNMWSTNNECLQAYEAVKFNDSDEAQSPKITTGTESPKNPASFSDCQIRRCSSVPTLCEKDAYSDENVHDSSHPSFSSSQKLLKSALRSKSSSSGSKSCTNLASLDTNNDTPSIKRNVSFSKLHFREYSLTLGDNPSCSYGAPVGLSDEYNCGGMFDLEDYEQKRGDRRSQRQMHMNYLMRQKLLIVDGGFTQHELKEAVKEVNRIKFHRDMTKALTATGRTEEAFESGVRKLKRLFGRKKSEK